ncbi:hypothetical protein JANAI62_17500 [Jannaschia pagri]|uniref:Uncharacterized protein n=1 Tax=Jannaschia pagri TaxID=2829797 RepID=A0ABQ4NLZ5_9RHOB|nr:MULTISPECIES: hypothetical protein [unclassified Jannaschia]GIT91294.1 hypothetical protein JANAI61_17520 [Jannaschia sp. AI_61]GIT95127.1 hypothetical protein JANAI62_17500 [Jannaschia sp. AI_62]
MTKTQKLNTALIALTSFAALVLTLPAQAQAANCGPRGIVVERLSSDFGETRRGIGLAPQNRVVEVFASDDNGTWTVTVTRPDGVTCLVASGQSWEDRMDDLSHLADVDT